MLNHGITASGFLSYLATLFTNLLLNLWKALFQLLHFWCLVSRHSVKEAWISSISRLMKHWLKPKQRTNSFSWIAIPHGAVLASTCQKPSSRRKKPENFSILNLFAWNLIWKKEKALNWVKNLESEPTRRSWFFVPMDRYNTKWLAAGIWKDSLQELKKDWTKRPLSIIWTNCTRKERWTRNSSWLTRSRWTMLMNKQKAKK